jgi:pimeloyl-ACP methyl ester carboxylesterase
VLENTIRRRLPLPERGVEIALIDWGGEGPLALLHHANGFCAALWDLVAQPLRESFHVVGMDARGHGDSSLPTDERAFEWTHFGADLAAVGRVLAEEHGAPIALGLGHSFGGTAMLLASAAEPALFERLLLVDPVLPPPPGVVASVDPERAQRGSTLIERARKRRALFPDRAAARESWAGKDMFAAWDPRAFELYLAEALGERTDGQVELKCRPETEAAIFSDSFGCDVWSVAAEVQVPVRLLWATRGDFPRFVFESVVSRMNEADIEDVDAGHLVPMERPERVVRAALEFRGGEAPPAARGVER